MNATQFIEILKTEKEVAVEDWDGEIPESTGGATVKEYELGYVPRHGLIPDSLEVLFDSNLDLCLTDNGAYRSDIVVRLSETAAAHFDIGYPEYCDDESDGDGMLVVYEWPVEMAAEEMEALVNDQRTAVVRAYLDPLIHSRDQLFGTGDWPAAFLKAVVSAVPAADRIGFLRSFAEEANEQVRAQARRRLGDEAPCLASLELEYDSAYDDEGGYHRFISTIRLTLLSGETMTFDGSWDYGCDSYLDDFAFEVEADLGIEFDIDREEHREAFFLWMENRLAVEEFEAFWSLLWVWIESSPGVFSAIFRDVEEQS